MDSVSGFVRDHPLVPGSAVAFILFYTFYKRIFPAARPVSSTAIGSAKEGETAPRRNKQHRNILEKPVDEVSTLYELLSRSAKKFADRKAVGWREVEQIIEEVKEMTTVVDGEERKEMKKWNYWQLSHYKWFTFAELFERVDAVGSGLVSNQVGLVPRESKLGIFCNTCPEWITIAHACFQHSIPVVTVYANLGDEGLTHAIQEGSLTHLFCNAELLPALMKVKPKCPSLRYVIYIDKPAAGAVEQVQSSMKALSFQELLDIGKAHPAKHTPPSPRDIAVIMYTSGTTDLPKGVMITHGNLVAALGGAYKAVDVFPNDVYIAYLPLAHVLELIIENFVLLCGLPLGYANPRTLVDSSVRNCKGDLTELKPTLMAGVPAVWERIRKGIIAKVAGASPVTRGLFNAAYKYKAWMIKGGASTPVVDAIVFKKFRAAVGGRVRAILSGGAPISRDTHEFLRCCFGIPVIQGYGLTECCGICTLMDLKDPGYERVGPPVACTEIKLIDVPEMKYFATDKNPRGEVLLRGPNVTLGYYKNEKKTQEDFVNGWFHTGDIGQWNPDGTLSIIDRKKNLVKLSHGEYVALEKLESKYKACKYVENMLVYGDSQKDYVVAVVLPVRAELTAWAKSRGVPSDNFEELCKSREAKSFITKELQDIGKKEGLKSYEQVNAVYLCPQEWTPENDLLTAAQKIKRQPIVNKYKNDIEALYK
eukprot:TRINITY_DN3194_c0_g1_i2.p1 TRINITY_DN3194_c0_g1~~TRINITY_DN3194_c0_g1_i2.p1  ORF type:complete len:706 (+),score=218.08 TRINITY_DN3194_c0_g1_i2:86-2203(+)